MSSKRYLPQVPFQTTNQSQLTSRSAIEDLFEVFENNAEFITLGKRLLNKKRKLEQLRAQLNLPDQLTNEDTVKLLKLRERLKAKRRLRKRFDYPNFLRRFSSFFQQRFQLKRIFLQQIIDRE
jgi:hypothetical protein